MLLSEVLTHPNTTLSTLQHALTIYDAIRRPFAQRVAEKSRENGILYTLNYDGLRFDRREDQNEDTKMRRLSEVYFRIRRNWEWAWETTIDEDLQRAVEMLEGAANGAH